ncbi:MAG: S9 family peptidase [Bacteroidota bacterium]
MKNKFFLLVLILFTITNTSIAQTITVEDIWRDYKFMGKSVPGFNFLNDGKHYARLENNTIKQYDLVSGRFVKNLFSATDIDENAAAPEQFDSYTFNGDETKILLETEKEKIYRRSSKANYYVWDIAEQSLEALYGQGKQSYATFSPADSAKVAFVNKNDLYVKDLRSGLITRITNDGRFNRIINGGADWVYEEEFSFAKAFHWSPDGQRIAFMRFDETKVKEFTMTKFEGGLYPAYETFKYPKVGEKNAVVTVHIYDLATKETVEVDTGKETDIYIPRIKWTKDPNQLCVFRMNRHQNELALLLANAKTGETRELLNETNKYYIDIDDDLTFLEDGQHFIWTSEKSGFNHIYLYDTTGTQKVQLTKGDYDVRKFYGVNQTTRQVYYQSSETSPLEENIYSVGLDGQNKQQLTRKPGTHNAQFSSTFDYFVNSHSTINSPTTYVVRDNKGGAVRTIEDNSDLVTIQDSYNTSPIEFFEFETKDEVTLNGWLLKPANFNPNRQYPVFMTLYGGPGSQQVKDLWYGQNYWWYQMLAQQGYVVACVDNRGTGARGEEFKKMTYLELGKYETIDQIEAAKYLGELDYTDASRIGIFGWSYGGFMSSLCLLKGNDVFKAAIAVAPVTSWRWYDSIYTERYMRTEKENPDGYKNNSPVYFADQLKGHYLLVHGGGDDNVHYQQSAEMMNALIAANKQFDTYTYPNRNHGIYGGTTRMHLYHKMTNFLNEKLKGDAINYNAPPQTEVEEDEE